MAEGSLEGVPERNQFLMENVAVRRFAARGLRFFDAVDPVLLDRA